MAKIVLSRQRNHGQGITGSLERHSPMLVEFFDFFRVYFFSFTRRDDLETYPGLAVG